MSENTFTPDAPVENSAVDPDDSTAPTLEAPAAEPAAKAATPNSASSTPAHTGMSVDQRAYQQYPSLAQIVLDSADLATKSAESAAFFKLT